MDIIRYLSQLQKRSQAEQEEKLFKKLVIKDMPYVYAMLAVGCSAGLSAQSSIERVGEYLPKSVCPPIEKALQEIEAGRSFSEAISSWNDIEHLRALAHLLIESSESGTSALVSLDAMARDANNAIRRQSEAAIKRLPVTMLFPLVLCILPAFMLLSVIPTLVNGFMSFNW